MRKVNNSERCCMFVSNPATVTLSDSDYKNIISQNKGLPFSKESFVSVAGTYGQPRVLYNE